MRSFVRVGCVGVQSSLVFVDLEFYLFRNLFGSIRVDVGQDGVRVALDVVVLGLCIPLGWASEVPSLFSKETRI